MAESHDYSSFLPTPPQTQLPSQQQQTRTGPQSDESRAIREAARQRLQEQRRREREAIRYQQQTVRWVQEEERRRQRVEKRAEIIRQREEERRRQQEERIRQQELERERHPQAEERRQWLERHRRRQEEEARRREELASRTRKRRRRAREARQELDLPNPEYESFLGHPRSLKRAKTDNNQRRRQPRQDGPSGTIPAQQAAPPDLMSMEMIMRHKEALRRLMQPVEQSFQEKQAASNRRDWCNPVPANRKIDTVQSFLKAFHDEGSMEIAVCSVCYLQKKPRDLDHVDWERALPDEIRSAMTNLLACKRCFPEGDGETVVPICFSCRAAFDRGRVPEACMGSTMLIGCEHRYPKELKDLTPLEEKLISFNVAYGFITKFNIQRGQLTGPTYRKHVAGHITVFPNDVESLAATILPHPLVSTLEQVHVIWTGLERPTPRDVSKLLSVRPGAIRTTLQWLRANNPLYVDIVINEEEMESWDFEGGSDVPTQAYQRMVREEETAEELIRTAQIVPPTDRGQDTPGQSSSVEDIAIELAEKSKCNPGQSEPAPHGVQQPPSLEEATAEETSERAFELRSSAMFPIDEQAAFAEQDKLDFISIALQAERQFDDRYEGVAGEAPSMQVHGSSGRPFIRVSHGREFADGFSPDYFPKTFPTCFPYGHGGPRAADRNEVGDPANPLIRDMTLESWAKVVLQRHGGHCAQHPAFSFLVFNMMVRSRNRWIAQGRLKRSAFRRVEGIHQRLTPERLREAQKEMFEMGKTTDRDVIALMKELSLYGSRHPLSNESRLSMRKKIWSMIVAFSLTAIWFTLNPNDINNPVKLKLAAHRGRDDEAARALLRALSTSLQVTTLSVHDPLSSTLFFFREISLFFEHYVRVGRPSVYGNVSHYYATVETNDRGALHLHGLLWLHGNLALSDLVRHMADPDEGEYRSKVKSFVDDIFTATLNEALAKEVVECGKKTTVVEPELIHDAEWLSRAFKREANFIASRCQVHHHTATCVKYSIKEVLKAGLAKCRTQLCRFRAPWRLVLETGFTDDGLLEVKRDHHMVNQYNQSMAIGLRHNHDVSMILTRKKGLALIHYICNYTTKLNAPMWKRLALAAELLDLARQQQGGPGNQGTTLASTSTSTIGDETKSFLLRIANRIFTSRELSQPEVLGYLLGFGTDFTNVPAWTWVHINSLYWACAKQWPGLKEALLALGRDPQPDNIYFQTDGFKLPYLEAYKHRGPILQELCFYDYMSFVVLKKERYHWRGTTPIPFPPTATVCKGWVQCLRTPVRRRFQEQLSDRVRSYVHNITLLRVSVEDARADRKIQGLDQDFEEIVDAHAFGDQREEEDGTRADEENTDSQEYYNAFLGVLTAARRSEIKDMPVSSVLRCLYEEARAIDMGEDDNTAAQRGRQFYTMLQDIQDAPFRGTGLLSREEIDAILKLQKKEDTSVTANIQGRESNASSAHADGPHRRPDVPRRPAQTEETLANGVGPAGQMRLEVGPYMSHVDVAVSLARGWTLNKLQSMAVLLPAVFLDERGTQLQEEEGKQHLQYVGGEGGTGKSRVIHAIKDMFRLKDGLHTLLVTGASGNAAALIGGVTLHSACNIGFEDKTEITRNISEEEKLRWKSKTMLIVDEISQVGGLTLASVDSRLRLYRDDAHRPFGGIPIVIFFGDFFQFDPVRQTSLLLSEPREHSKQRPESLAKHVAAHKLFLQFTTVVMLREQVRTAGCARLRGFLRRLRNGQQTELDFQRLYRRLYNQASQPSFADGLRAVTPLNQDRWDLNMAAIVQWARAQSKHISIFVAKHDTKAGKRLRVEELCDVLRYGDDSQLPTPGLFFYAQGMPVVVTRNQLTGLKLVNGAPFKAVDIFPDLACGTIALASDVTLHLGPPAAVLLQSDDIADLAVPGLPKGTLLIKSKTVVIPDSMRGKNSRSRSKPGFQLVTHRTGPLCTPAFAMTDQKSQGKQFSEVLLNLKGVYGSSSETRPSFMSLYVQLSRAERWEGLYLFRRPARGDFIEPKNVLGRQMRDGVYKLERLGGETRLRFEHDYRHESWFRDWDAIAESTSVTEVDEEDDTSLWCESEDDESES
ncbi:hypothetical protein FOXG_22453 [Fusarium oxysporum f. sp. lycopersici 4287]|uniref:ATP-dependent DNA helicase n=3 Tax=Fusarium oxysporum TaxID=5507 RepID=A0A0J9V794_FUSO4|nr:hypothetical protein FOXG_06452 [Fusarium oxysporum f. sp. lycopersici 4287]XP_018244751.1 hypothetical protein FOXG_19766 [Fusarium oxysporum f. sp. lycopersici 4287]XP_018257052.1 uncharacterized protein FOXG_22453 [Fusarium oxysporum f. sp. lycopersici 4287]KNB04282.1 hypothetical protein FOXG_06452 [Fusarium oxysporum f. sp. lycopersici 4287]KNB06706.1 hypothetical protein FOXG_19766 [Fusarium oxysporum f. sp. lycopersici 4287]KNB19007.1 hypothetical protein FOXG_22453 [Fusarium oxyspor